MSSTSTPPAPTTAPTTGPAPETPTDSGGLFKQPRAVWAVAFACVIAFMGIGLVDPILKEIAAKLGATGSQVSLLFTSYMAVMGVAMLVTGAISSRIGPKKTLLAGLGLIIVFAGLAGLSGSVWGVIGFRAGWGLGNALFVATALATIVQSSKGSLAQAIILFEAALGLGIASGPLIGGVLGEQSWRAPFFGVSALMLIALIGTTFFLPATPPTSQKISVVDPLKALAHPALAVLAIVAVCYNLGFFTLMAAGPFALETFSIMQVGWTFFGWGVLLAFTSVAVAPVLQRRFGVLPTLVAMLALFSLDLAAMALGAEHTVVVVAGIVIAGAFLGVINTLVTEAVMGSAPVPRPVASAAYSFVRFTGGAIGPFVALKLFEHTRGAEAPFWFGAISVAVGVVVLLLGGRVVKRAISANHASAPAEHSEEEAEAVLIGDLD